MGIQKRSKVLGIGRGNGGPAREIGHFIGAHVTDLNNNDYQINHVKRYAVAFDLDKRSDFIKGNDVYGEAYRILMPGKVFKCCGWEMTDSYDPTNPEHLRIVRDLEVDNGIVKMRSIKGCLKALKTVGSNIEINQDMGATVDEIKWCLSLQDDIRQGNTLWIT
ncbi:Delta(24)-sterol C-methyltransferase [Mortierella sp. AM989]|nr:Delta(24)-sterol C-methyltransferase [Mortierella sp. AM989]